MSEYTAAVLPPLLAAAFAEGFPKGQAPEDIFHRVFAEYDESLVKPVLDLFSGRPPSDWTPWEVHLIMGPKDAVGEPGSVFSAARRAPQR